jgi:hypothetical protein
MQPNERDEPPTLGQVDAELGPMQAPIGADGLPGPPMGLSEPAPPEPMSPANSPCLRGPCRHFMRLSTRFEAGNPDGTFPLGKEPRQLTMFCDAISGTYLEMGSDSFPLECNRWDPIPPAALSTLEKRRQRYFDANPEHRPLTAADLNSMVSDDDKEHA